MEFNLKKHKGRPTTLQRRGVVLAPAAPRRCVNPQRRDVAVDRTTLQRYSVAALLWHLQRRGVASRLTTLQRCGVVQVITTLPRCSVAALRGYLQRPGVETVGCLKLWGADA